MTKPRRPKDNRPDTSEWLGDGRYRTVAAEAKTEESGGKQGDKAVDPTPHRRREPT